MRELLQLEFDYPEEALELKRRLEGQLDTAVRMEAEQRGLAVHLDHGSNEEAK